MDLQDVVMPAVVYHVRDFAIDGTVCAPYVVGTASDHNAERNAL